MERLEIKVNDTIVLRLYQEHDAAELFKLIAENRTHFRKWLPWLDANTTAKDAENFIVDCMEKYKAKTSLSLGIYYKNKLVGSVGFNSLDKANKSAPIGYMLGKKFNGKGIMTQSCKALINYGFNELNLNRIDIKAGVENSKSRAIPERLGFKQEGILQQAEFLYNHYIDVAVYGMLKENWK